MHYLPLALLSMQGRLAMFQCVSRSFWYDLVRTQVEEARARAATGDYETPGFGEGARAVVARIMGLGRTLKHHVRTRGILGGTSLQLWLFSNSGSSPDCEIIDIPDVSVQFLLESAAHGLEPEINNLIKTKESANRFFDAIVAARDFSGLYPDKTAPGVSRQLYELYQSRIRGKTHLALSVARRIAGQARVRLVAELPNLLRKEAMWEASGRQRMRRLMVDLAAEGAITLADYHGLFPIQEGRPGIETRPDGWNLLRYYLNHGNGDEPIVEGSGAMAPKEAAVRFYAGAIWRDYVESQGRDRFVRDVLGGLSHDRLGSNWLRGRFLRLAWSQEGFSYAAYAAVTQDQTGKPHVREPLYQMRLWWTEAARGSTGSGSTLIVCNHVKTAQMIYAELKSTLDSNVLLLHGRFNAEDRNRIEALVTRKALPRVLVATRVIEVSLNVDFHRAFVEPAPIDALVQRFGRVIRGA